MNVVYEESKVGKMCTNIKSKYTLPALSGMNVVYEKSRTRTPCCHASDSLIKLHEFQFIVQQGLTCRIHEKRCEKFLSNGCMIILTSSLYYRNS